MKKLNRQQENRLATAKQPTFQAQEKNYKKTDILVQENNYIN